MTQEWGIVPDTSFDLYTGMVAVPDSEGLTVIAEIQDEAVKAVEAKSDGRGPAFDGWYCKKAVMWILDHVGIPVNPDWIEDTGLALTSAPPGEDPLWQAEEGRAWRDVLYDICLFDYMSSIRITPTGYPVKGCYYCGGLRNEDEESPHYAPLHAFFGWQSTACFAEDVEQSENAYGVDRFITLGAGYRGDIPTGIPETLTHEGGNFRFHGHMIEEEYYNHCKVKGAKFMGKDDPLSLEFTDWPSVHGDVGTYNLGYKKAQDHTFEWATNYPTLNRVGRSLFYRHLSPPLFVELVIPFSPDLRPRRVVGIYGREMERKGLNASRWRIVDLSHTLDRRTGVWPTTIRCRYIGEMSSAE